MSIKVKRATGIMGGASNIALKVDNQVVKKLKNNEEYIIQAEKATVKAKQWFFGSKAKQVERGNTVEIKINNMALLFYIISLVLVLFGKMISPIIIVIGLIGVLGTIVYSTKNWFELEVE
ncbi:hypothetical protein [Risungbinella massiliensis]|uniref:hypothetical protein n=1 Tax=Risungbinella massiliensis TaxID=1329796 RepID=UPI0005CBA28B|nr:hypothetical protein [Risungbinella massiliensis]